MIVLDENIPENQRQLLRGWRVRVHQIGHEVGRQGMQDDEIYPPLHQLDQPTFCSRDKGFYLDRRCHADYCLVFPDVAEIEAASFIRRFLRHPDFKTRARRMGTVVRVSHIGIHFWRLHAQSEAFLRWP
jgi:hypothetical protein